MVYRLKSEGYALTYTESVVDHPVLWESHCHAQFEMIAVADGDITVMMEGEGYRLQKNRVLIIPPLFYHSVMANGEGRYCRLTALFGLDVIPKVLQESFIKQGRATVIPASHLQTIKGICQGEDASFYAPLVKSLMVELFYDAYGSPPALEKNETDAFLKQTFQYIDQHLHEKILLDDLAAHTSRSKSSFCHLFEAKMHISPKQYILQKKLACASKLIDEGVPHTLAAMQVGYENYSNFYRLYRKHQKNSSKEP